MGRSRSRLEGLAQQLCQLVRMAALRNGAEFAAVIELQTAKRDSAEAVRLLQYRLEHRGEFAGRRIDHLQYIGGRGLLLQGLARLAQEPRVLHRDDRLRGKILQEGNLPFGERPDLLAKCGDDADECFILPQRHDHRVGAWSRWAVCALWWSHRASATWMISPRM